MSVCEIKGCANRAKYRRIGVEILLPGHPTPVHVGDIKLCPAHERSTRAGARANLREDIVAAAIARKQ